MSETEKLTATLTRRRDEPKHSVCYIEPTGVGIADPRNPLASIYVNRKSLPDPTPKSVKVTIEWEE